VIPAERIAKAISGGGSDRPLEEMTVEELEALFHVMDERAKLAWWGGFAFGATGGAFGYAKLAALLTL
jgi:hypothetical protein